MKTNYKFQVGSKVTTKQGSNVKILDRYKTTKFGNIYQIQYPDGYINPNWLFEYLIIKQN